MSLKSHLKSVATQNPCRLCAPLGACLAFAGIQGAIPFIHGSQGCATYIRRYLISHFREPLDIASSSFSEESAIFGGAENFRIGIENVVRQYNPDVIGIATTCLSETIGENMEFLIRSLQWEHKSKLPQMVLVSTPSYRDSHLKGFFSAVKQTVAAFATPGPKGKNINIFAPIISPADLRYLKEICDDFEVAAAVIPDYSDTLDGQTLSEYKLTHNAGTSLDAIRMCSHASVSLDLSYALYEDVSATKFLADNYAVPSEIIGFPIGIKKTDVFFNVLASASSNAIPAKHAADRGRLLDSYVDGHKYVFEKRAIVYGEEDLVISMAVFLAEIGIIPVLCASGGNSGKLERILHSLIPQYKSDINVLEDADFVDIEAIAEKTGVDLIIGNSSGYKLAKKLAVPLVRVGLPIHDRIGAARILHIGYRGTQQLYDRIVNAIIAADQNSSPIGYSHM